MNTDCSENSTCKDEKDQPNYLIIGHYALSCKLNEIVSRTHKIIATITKIQIKQEHHDNHSDINDSQFKHYDSRTLLTLLAFLLYQGLKTL